MAISAITPQSTAVLAPNDQFAFTIDNTYTDLTIAAETQAGTQTIYDTALGGAQAGFTVTVTDNGDGTETFVVVRDIGWDENPFIVTVVEDESGSSVTTTFTYYLTSTKSFPQSQNPYYGNYTGDLIVTDDEAAVRTDVGWIDFVGATVTNLGNGKIRVTTSVASSIAWGNVTGTLSAQTDLQAALDDKLPSDGTTKVYHVAKSGTPYTTVAAAIAQAVTDGLSSSSRATILVHPGTYTTTAAISVPSWVTVQGINKHTVRMTNATTDLFDVAGDNVWFQDFLVEGAANASVWAFDCNGYDAVHVRNVDMLNNGGTSTQGFLRQTGADWATMFVEHCVVDSYKTSGTLVYLEDTGAAVGNNDVIFNDVFFDMFSLTGFGFGIRAIDCADVRVRNSTIRGAATYMTGVRIEANGATGTPQVDVRHSWLGGGPGDESGGGVAIYNEAGTDCITSQSYYPGAVFDGSHTDTDGASSGFVTTDGTTQQDAVRLTERADHKNTPSAGIGEVWSKSDAPNSLWFTNDLAEDVLLTHAGMSGGSWKFSTTTTASDPGAGYWRLNTASYDTATALYISTTDRHGHGLHAMLTRALGPDAQLVIVDEHNTSYRYRFWVTSFTDNSGWLTVNLDNTKDSKSTAAPTIPTVEYPLTITVTSREAQPFASWTVSSVASGVPAAAGNLSVNSATPGSVTTISLYDSSNDLNVGNILSTLKSGDHVILRARGGGFRLSATLGADATDNTSYVTLGTLTINDSSGTIATGQIVDVIPVRQAAGAGGGSVKTAFSWAGAMPSSPTIDTWYGWDDRGIFTDQLWSDTFGTGTTPVLGGMQYAAIIVPFNGTITDLLCWGRSGGSANNGTIAVYKATYTDGSTTEPTLTVCGSGQTVAFTNSDEVQDFSQTSLSVSVTKGDHLYVMYRGDATSPNATGLYLRGTIVIQAA